MRGEETGRRTEQGEPQDEAAIENKAGSPVALEEPLIRPLERRKAQLLGRQPWHDPNGRLDWNAWANDVRQLWERLADVGVATGTMVRATKLAGIHFDKHLSLEANFTDFVFPGDVLFEGIKFAKGAQFGRAIFHGRVSFVARGDGEKVDGCEFTGAARFDGAVFIDDADFSDVRFGPTVSFEGAKFRKSARFDDAQFNRGALFGNGSEFGSGGEAASASFVRARFSQGGFGDKTDFTATCFHHDADFTRAEFVGGKNRLAPVQFDRATFRREAKFVETQFGTVASDGTVRRCQLSFDGASFAAPPDFTKSVHRNELVLVASLLARGASFNEIKFEEPVRVPARNEPGWMKEQPDSDFPLVSFRSSIFCRGLQWPSARLPVALDFFAAEFLDRVVLTRCTLGAEHSRGVDPSIGHNFAGAKFLEEVDATQSEWNLATGLPGASFKKRALFDGAVFKGDVDFTTSEFLGPLSMAGAKTLVDGAVRFDQSTFREICNFSNVEVQGVAHFGGCTFGRTVTFESARFLSGGHFDDSEFSRAVRFTNAVFGKPAELSRISFERATFQQMAYFDQVKFHSEPDFSGARSVSSFSFGDSKFFDTLPRLSAVSLQAPPPLDRIDIQGEPRNISQEGRLLRGGDLQKEVASRYLALSLLARTAGDADRDRDFTRRSQGYSPDRGFLVRAASTLFRIVSDSGYSFGKPALGLLMTALVVFPAIYLIYYGGEQRNVVTTVTKLSANWDLPCVAGEGSALLMAIHKSLKSTIPGFGDADGRQDQISKCLYGVANEKVSYPVIVLSPVLQGLCTLAWLSLLTLAVRNHLRVR